MEFSSHNLRRVLGFEPRRPGVHSGLARHGVTRLCNFLEPCFPAGSLHPLWKALVSSLQQVFTWGAEHAETKHPSLAPGTGNWESLGLGVLKVAGIFKVTEGKE